MTPRTPCSNWLPIEPMRRVIQRDAQRLWDAADVEYAKPCKYPGLTLLAHQTGIGERQLRRWLEENEYAEEGAVDRYCCATGRHLFDLYPELDAPDTRAWVDECPCGGVYFDVEAEGPHRMLVRCRACRRRTAVEDRSGKRTGPRPDCWALTPDEVDEAIRIYADGVSLREIARRLGVSMSTVQRWFVQRGVQCRSRNLKPLSEEARQRGLDVLRVYAWPRRQIALWMRGKGCTLREIGQRISMTEHGVTYTLRAARQSNVVTHHCDNATCDEFRGAYPVPPSEVLERAPELDRCPACGVVGVASGLPWDVRARETAAA